jgi:hypothetical protein
MALQAATAHALPSLGADRRAQVIAAIPISCPRGLRA